MFEIDFLSVNQRNVVPRLKIEAITEEQDGKQEETTRTETLPKVTLNHPKIIVSNYSDRQSEIYHMVFPEKYSTVSQLIEEHKTSDNKTIKVYACGRKEVLFPTGLRRESYPDGYTVIFFENKDIRQHYPNEKMVYYFSDHKITQTITEQGDKILLFPNG